MLVLNSDTRFYNSSTQAFKNKTRNRGEFRRFSCFSSLNVNSITTFYDADLATSSKERPYLQCHAFKRRKRHGWRGTRWHENRIDCAGRMDIDASLPVLHALRQSRCKWTSWRLTWPKWVPAPCAQEGIAASWKKMLRAVCNKENTMIRSIPSSITSEIIIVIWYNGISCATLRHYPLSSNYTTYFGWRFSSSFSH